MKPTPRFKENADAHIVTDLTEFPNGEEVTVIAVAGWEKEYKCWEYHIENKFNGSSAFVLETDLE